MPILPLIIIPDPDEPDGAAVYVDGTIAGQSYRFLLDTGAGRSSVITDAFTAAFASDGVHESSGAFAAIHDDLITVPRLDVGPITRQAFTLARSPAGPGPKTLIGMDLLKDFRCHFRFEVDQLVVNGDHVPAEDGDLLPLTLDQKQHPYVAVQFGAVQAQAVWDTGASITVVDSNFVARHPALFTPAGQSTGIDASGTTLETPMYVMAAATMGGHTFPPVRVAAVDLGPVNARIEMPMDLILGYSSLRHADWLFDFPGRQWAITKWLVK
jgi:predicted aspartyl protease